MVSRRLPELRRITSRPVRIAGNLSPACHRTVNISQYLSRSRHDCQNCQNPSRPAMVSHNSPRPITLGGCLLGPAGRRCRGCIANLEPADAAVNAGSSGEGIGTILTSRQAVLVHSSLILSTYDCFCIPAVYNGNARKQAVFASPNGYNCGNSGRCERHFWHVKPMRLSSAIVITT